MTPADLRVPPEPVPLTDAELIDAPQEVARMLAARNAEPDTVSLEDEQRRIDPYYDRLFAFQERVIVTPTETLRGCAAKLRVIFDPDNGPCATAIEDRELSAVAKVVEVIERAITPPPDNADTALLDAERELLAMVPPLETDPNGGSAKDWQRFGALENTILTTPAETLAGAVVKLRRLADPAQGMEAVTNPLFFPALVQALAVIEREAGGHDHA